VRRLYTGDIKVCFTETYWQKEAKNHQYTPAFVNLAEPRTFLPDDVAPLVSGAVLEVAGSYGRQARLGQEKGKSTIA
jgi:hypothetical protein